MRRLIIVSTILIVFALPSISYSDDRAVKRQLEKMRTEKRVALVIGNGNYKNSPLKNPVNDARLMAATLKKLGFEVIPVENGSKRQMLDAVSKFGKQIRNGGVGLFYFAGHGIQVNARNYLIPLGAHIEVETDVEIEGLDVARVLGRMDTAGNRLNIVMLDACRNNPYTRSFRSGANNGLAQVDAPRGTFIAYATAPGSVAADGDGKNGLFTEQFVSTITSEGLTIENVFKQVRTRVRKNSGGKQIPWQSSSLEGNFYFKMPTDSAKMASLTLPPTPTPTHDVAMIYLLLKNGKRQEMTFNGFNTECAGYKYSGVKYTEDGMSINIPWNDIKFVIPTLGISKLRNGHKIKTKILRTRNCKGAYLSESRSRHVKIAGYDKVINEELKVDLSDVKLLAFNAEWYDEGMSEYNNLMTDTAHMVFVKGGCFQMGDTFGSGDSDEKPVHEVCIDDFYIDRTEVTQSAYMQQTGSNPSKFRGDNLPVEHVSWHDAKAYCQQVSKRLPTEAEWEYSARSGGKKEKYAGTSGSPYEYALYDKNSGSITHLVDYKRPNGLGIYNMSGNVWEWCSDWYDEKYYRTNPRNNPKGPVSGESRVLRGGSWYCKESSMSTSLRYWDDPDALSDDIGFRCAMTP